MHGVCVCVCVFVPVCVFPGYIEEACIIPCPSDCKLSEWSNWSRCSKSCGSGVKVRSKWLREKPYNGGRPCPKLDHVNQVSHTHTHTHTHEDMMASIIQATHTNISRTTLF